MAKSEHNDWSHPEYKRSDVGEIMRGKYAQKQFANLSKSEHEKVESKYQRMKPEDFDKAIARAKTVHPEVRSKWKQKE